MGKCKVEKCKKIPNYAYKGAREADTCRSHKIAGMVFIKQREYRCKFIDENGKKCRKVPAFDFGDRMLTKGRFCELHQLPGMTIIKPGKRCYFTKQTITVKNKETNSKIVNIKFDDNTETFEYINSDGLNSEIDRITANTIIKEYKSKEVDEKTTTNERCYTYASFNHKDATYRRYCKFHSKTGMVCISAKTCDFPGCEVFPSYNFPGNNTRIRCEKHRDEGMIYL